MPQFPEFSEPLPIQGGDLPAREDAVQSLVPVERRSDAAPVQNDLLAAEVAAWREHERHAEEAAGQCSPLTATGTWLESLGAERKVFRQDGESQEAYRDRIYAPPELISPRAILDAVSAAIAPYTDVLPRLSESILDGWYVGDDTATWSSHVYSVHGPSRSPHYPDRLYPDDAAENGGHFRLQSEPDGAVPMDGHGRMFTIRIPDLGSQSLDTFVTSSDDGWLIEDGTAAWSSHVWDSGLGASTAYAVAINTVAALRAHSIRWVLIVDPHLT